MSNLTRRGPNANASARLPGIQTTRVSDPNTRQALEALREWVEVRLGARGDFYERAVTQREFETRLDPLVRRLEAVEAAASARAGGTVEQADYDAFKARETAADQNLRGMIAALSSRLQDVEQKLRALI